MWNKTLKQAADFIYASISGTFKAVNPHGLLFDPQGDEQRRKRKRSSRACSGDDDSETAKSTEESASLSVDEILSSSSGASRRDRIPAEAQQLSPSSSSSATSEDDGSDNASEYESASEFEAVAKAKDTAINSCRRKSKRQRARQVQQSLDQEAEAMEEEDELQAKSGEETECIFPVGTLVRKHFPSDGWYDGGVTRVRWNDSRDKWAYDIEYEGRDATEVVDQKELKDMVLPKGRYIDPTVYPFDDFLNLWEGLDPEAVEKSSAVRRANSKISNEDSGTQSTAQYGRILPRATDILFHVLRLKRSDVYLDIGSGVGNSCLQSAYCTGCESRGIEIVKDRYHVSLDFTDQIGDMAKQLDENTGRTRLPGEVILRHGDLADGAIHNWLVKANKVFVNNFGGVFAERCVSLGSTWHLDHYIAGLFASMEEESLMITLSDLQMGPTRKEVNKWRTANKMETSPNASFFDVVKVELGEASQVFSWSQSSTEPAIAYVYRRVKQDPNLRTASIMCCNRDCAHSRSGIAIPAVTYNKEGKAVVGACPCKRTSLRSRRDITVVTFQEFLNPDGEYSEWGR